MILKDSHKPLLLQAMRAYFFYKLELHELILYIKMRHNIYKNIKDVRNI